jgi:hypothetical protein
LNSIDPSTIQKPPNIHVVQLAFNPKKSTSINIPPKRKIRFHLKMDENGTSMQATSELFSGGCHSSSSSLFSSSLLDRSLGSAAAAGRRKRRPAAARWM